MLSWLIVLWPRTACDVEARIVSMLYADSVVLHEWERLPFSIMCTMNERRDAFVLGGLWDCSRAGTAGADRAETHVPMLPQTSSPCKRLP